MEDVVEVLRKIDIDGGDPRWPVSVQLEKRTSIKDGKNKTYLNLLVAVGQKKLFIPRRVSKDVAKALDQLAESANQEYTALLEVGSKKTRNR